MQNRYVGDIGDYMKLSILRALSPGRQLGVAWWLFPDSGAVGDGRHISYLKCPEKWKKYDPPVFNALHCIVESKDRQIQALEDADLLANATYSSEPIPVGKPSIEMKNARTEWFARCQKKLEDRDLIFLDPDNGLETKNFSLASNKAGKSVSFNALTTLRKPGRILVVYHHHTRFPGGHLAELRHWADRLREQGFQRVDALRAKPYSPRAFFILDADDETRKRAEAIEKKWNGLISWHADGITPQLTAKAEGITLNDHGTLFSDPGAALTTSAPSENSAPSA